MTDRRKLHPDYRVNIHRAATEETKVASQGYVVRWHGNREYFSTYKKAVAFRKKLRENPSYATSDIRIINIARQGSSSTKVKKLLFSPIGAKFSGHGLTSGELASMVLGRMGEATSHTFGRVYATTEMRRQAQRALRHMMRSGRGRMSEEVARALALKLPGKTKTRRKK